MSKVSVFFGTGFEEIEALSVVDILRRAGIETDMVSITGQETVTSSHGVTVSMDKNLEEVDFSSLDMIVLPGGMPGTKNLEACDLLMEQVDSFFEKGKWIAAICAAPTIFGHRGILKGKKACCFPGMQNQLEGAEVSYEKVVVDGNVITSRGMGTALEFALKLLEVLTDAQTATQMATTVVYKEE